MRLVAALVGLLLAVPAFAQTGTVRQNGTVSPGHPTMWTTTGIIQDAGTSAKGGLTTLGITAAGSTPFCINNGQTTGPYSAFCLGANPTSGNALLSVTAVNGATPMGLNFNMNGNLSSFSIGANGVPNIGSVSVNPLIVGTSPNNILTLTPGAASTNPIVFNSSGTGGFQFNNGIVSAPGVNLATGTLNWTDATAPHNLNAHNVWTGTSTLTSQLMLNRILTIDSISYPAGSFGSSQFIDSLDIQQQFGGSTSTGPHIALNVQTIQTASTGNFAAGGDFNAVGAFFGAQASFNEGGTSFVAGSHFGSLFGFNPGVTLKSGGTFFTEVAGGEVNLSIQSGSSVFVKYGVTFTKEAGDHVQGASGLDAALAMSDQLTAVPWFYGIEFGNEGGQWAFDSNAVLIGSRLNSAQATQMGAAKWDLDFLSNTTSQGLIQGPGFNVGPTGIVRVGFGALKPNSAGMVITADGLTAATATVATPGTGYSGGMIYDANGNIWSISVDGGGGITGATIVQAVQTATATTPIAIPGVNYSLAASGGSLNVSYASGTDIIMPGLPTSAPSTHCALWSNSNVINRTTCP